MTITLFVSMLTAGSVVSSLLTEAIKQAYKNAGKQSSANIIALINSVVVGGGGTAAIYMLMGIPWNINNVICLVGTTLTVWVMCQCGYDKVKGVMLQLGGIANQIQSSTDKE